MLQPDEIGPASPAHLQRISLVGPYVYSYDVATTPSQPSAAVPSASGLAVNRAIPNMRPAYDAEYPSSSTPIYDSLYSEYRRLFRALPGDRSGEENLRFTGFAVREPAPSRSDNLPYPKRQAFHTYPGHAHGTPQYMPTQPTALGPISMPASDPATSDGQLGENHGGPGGQHRPSTGQGWVATGYLPTAHPHSTGFGTPTGSPGSPGSPADRFGTAGPTTGYPSYGHHTAPAPYETTGYQGGSNGQATTSPSPSPSPTPGTGGRHRSMLSLPPGRIGEQA